MKSINEILEYRIVSEMKQSLIWIRESNLIEAIDDKKEDHRCLRVWQELQGKELSVTTILWIHRRVMWVLHRSIAGHWRECNVQVGSHIPTDWRNVPCQIQTWVRNNEYPYGRNDESIRQGHIDFETIHPFRDGNGRVGRILMNWQRKNAGLEPLLIKASERASYYRWFTC